MKNLFLDDLRKCPEGWVLVKNYNEFVSYIIENGLPNFISFDHDLADVHYSQEFNAMPELYDTCEEKTGLDCAKWLLEYCRLNKLPFPQWQVHSMNPVGKQNIINLLSNHNQP